ncbi:hypothetical protein SUGI_0579420 [Cryptomeria japonica]|nr:hypothetical protein SUGI_0579420 [Cryptomeria japonica]
MLVLNLLVIPEEEPQLAPGATGDYHTLLTSNVIAIAKGLSTPLEPSPHIFVPGQEDCKPGRSEGYFGFLHIKAIDDAGHHRATMVKVKSFEAVDIAIGQLVLLLGRQNAVGLPTTYSLCITGDHSTPVEYANHNYEPVHCTLCHLKDFVNAKV